MRYHERTKHRFNRYADGPRQLDWANQPNPFRRFEGAPLVHLPLLGAREAPLSPRYNDLYRRGSVPSADVTIQTLSRLLQYALSAGTIAHVEFSVSDTGPGLPAEVLAALFVPFTTTKAHGLGVGLAISQMIVDAHGGTIGTHENPGGGATFTVKLPRSAPSNRQKTA